MFLETKDPETATWRSELFDMCTEIIVDKRQLIEFLAGELEEWAERYGGELVKNRVMEAVPSEHRLAIQTQLGADAGAGAWLKAATLDCRGRSAEPVAHENSEKTLEALYQTVLPILWPKLSARLAVASLSTGIGQNSPEAVTSSIQP